TDLLAELSNMDPRWRRLDGKRLARMLHGYGMTQTNKDQRSSARRSPRATGGSTSRTSGRATCHLRLHRLQGLHRLQTRGTTMSDLPTDIEVGDAYALRTFALKDGRLASIAQRGGHWEDGK